MAHAKEHNGFCQVASSKLEKIAANALHLLARADHDAASFVPCYVPPPSPPPPLPDPLGITLPLPPLPFKAACCATCLAVTNIQVSQSLACQQAM